MADELKKLQSNDVKVYPSARRGATNSYSRLLTEEAITRLVNSFLDFDGFVISNENENTFRFNIEGYYFEVNRTALQNLFTTGSSIYAHIHLVKYGEYWELDGLDVDSVYEGVVFKDNNTAIGPETSTSHWAVLKLLEKSGNTWKIPTESKYKFDLGSQGVNVDGGVI